MQAKKDLEVACNFELENPKEWKDGPKFKGSCMVERNFLALTSL